jgi:hypothetical protein
MPRACPLSCSVIRLWYLPGGPDCRTLGFSPEMAGHQARLLYSLVSAVPRVPVSFQWAYREHTIDPLSFSCKLAGHSTKAAPTLPPLQNSQALASPCSRKPAHAAERRTPAFARVTGKEVVVKYIHKPRRAR